MIIDQRTLLDDAHAFSASGASSSYLDLGVAADLGPGTDVELIINVDVAPDHGTGDETYTYAIQSDDNSSFSSPTTLFSVTIPRDCAAGTKFSVCLPYAVAAKGERYLRGYATLGGTTPSVTLTTFLSNDDAPKATAYPNAI